MCEPWFFLNDLINITCTLIFYICASLLICGSSLPRFIESSSPHDTDTYIQYHSWSGKLRSESHPKPKISSIFTRPLGPGPVPSEYSKSREISFGHEDMNDANWYGNEDIIRDTHTKLSTVQWSWTLQGTTFRFQINFLSSSRSTSLPQVTCTSFAVVVLTSHRTGGRASSYVRTVISIR